MHPAAPPMSEPRLSFPNSTSASASSSTSSSLRPLATSPSAAFLRSSASALSPTSLASLSMYPPSSPPPHAAAAAAAPHLSVSRSPPSPFHSAHSQQPQHPHPPHQPQPHPQLSARPPLLPPSSALFSSPSPFPSSFPPPTEPPQSPLSGALDERSAGVVLRVFNLHFPGYSPLTASSQLSLALPSSNTSSSSSSSLLQPSPSAFPLASLLAPSTSSASAPSSAPLGFVSIPSTPSPPPPSASPSGTSPLSSPPLPTEGKGEEEKEEKDWEGGASYRPSLFLSAYQQAHHQPFAPSSALTLSSLSAIIVERLQERRGYHFLHSSFMRLQAERERQAQQPLTTHTSSTASVLLSSLHSLIVHHAQLLLQCPDTLPERLSSGPRQLVSFLLSHCDLPSSSILGLLSAALSTLSPLRVDPLSQVIFAHLTHDMREQTFIHADHWKPPAVLAHLLTLPPLAHHFTLLPHFIYPWFNGYKIETDSPLGLFLKLTTLPDEPSVGEKFFTAPLHMTDVERLFCMGRLNRKLDKAQDLLASSWCTLLRGEHSRAGLLTWTSTMLLSNWGRTRMRSQRKSTSNDGFLLNVASVMLRVGEREGFFSSSSSGRSASLALLDPFYCLLPSRLDVKEETKICATTHDEQAWLNEFYAQATAAAATGGGGGGSGGSAGRGTAMGGAAAVTAGAAAREDKGRAVSMDEGEEGKEEKQSMANGSMELSYSSPSPAIDLAASASSSSSSSVSSGSEERKSKFKRARLSLGGLRSYHGAGGAGEVVHVPSNSLNAPSGSSSSSSMSPSLASALSPALPPSPALLPLPATSPPPFVPALPLTSTAASFSVSSSSASPSPAFPASSSHPSPSSSSSSSFSVSASSASPSSPPSSSSSSSLLRVGDVAFSSPADREYFVSSSCSTHYAIVCNKCRTQDLEGSRYKCFPALQTRLLTDAGFLFLDEIQRRIDAGKRVRYACYAPSAQAPQVDGEDVLQGQLLYRHGDLFFPPPSDVPQTLIEVSSTNAQRRWAEGSGAYGIGLGSSVVDEDEDEAEDEMDHVSLLVTPDHDMYVQMGNLDRRGRDFNTMRIPPSKVKASQLLGAPHDRASVRLLACASSGHTPAPERAAQEVMAVKAKLGLTSDAQFDAFLELFGFWLGQGTLAYHRSGVSGAVRFKQIQKADIDFLDAILPETGLSARDVRRSVCQLQRADGELKMVVWDIVNDAWFTFFDAEFGVKYSSSHRYDRKAALAKQGNARLFAPSLSVTPPSATRSLHTSSACSSSPSACDDDSSEPEEEETTTSSSSDDPSESDDEDEPPTSSDDDLDDPDDPNQSVKWLPAWSVMHLPSQRLRLLIHGLYRADGSFKDDTRGIHTSGVAFRDQLMQALLHCGYTATASLMYSAGAVRGYHWHDQACERTVYTIAEYTRFSPEEQANYVEIRANADSWAVWFREPAKPGKGPCWPIVRRQQGIVEVPYSEAEHGRIWCVKVNHPDHLIIAQRAQRDPNSHVVNKQSRPIVVGQCLQCKDYDLCAACEQQTFIESLGLSHSTGVTFPCPYSHCGVVGLRERQLRDHVHAVHENDVSLVACPICSANGSAQTVLTQPSFDLHLNKEHCDEHDPTTHVTLKVTHIIPHSHRKYFTAQDPYPLEDISALVSEAERRERAQPQLVEAVDEANAALAELVTRGVVHRVACSHCRVFPIRGVAFKCHHCSSYWLCSECEGAGWEVHGHHPAHVFAKFRRPLQAGQSIAPEPLLYPSAMLGSHGFSLQTEWFFLTLHTLHVGMLKTCSRYTSLVQSIESESDARKLDSLMKVKLCVDAQLLHPRLLKDSLALYVFVSRWIAILIDPAHQGDSIALPLSSLSIPMEFAALPEYLIEDMADLMLFLSRFSIDTMESMNVTPILHLFVTLVSATPYLNNPYLRAKLVEVFCGVAEFPTAHGPGCPSLSRALTSDAFVISHLMPALIRLYVDIEHTGSDSQFYDKFNVRHAIAVLMKFLADFPPHVQRMEEEALDVELFVRFANSIINDMIYLLDEALIKAAQLHELQAVIQAQRAAALTFNQMNARRQEQERAAQISRSLRTAAVLATHTVNLLWTLCLHPHSAAILLRPEMIDRITASINTYVVKIAGPKRDAILVKDSAAASYHHDQWLNVFTDIYLAFRDNAAFRLSIVKDSRCFTPADFHRAADLLEERKLKTKERLSELHSLIQRLAALNEEVQSDWDELGDVPEEFLDPILNTLMEDPVLLPSGVAMDRAVITRHLLNKRMDPFNRQPLDVKDLRDYPDMRLRIQQWKMGMRRKRAEERKGQAEGSTSAPMSRRVSLGDSKSEAGAAGGSGGGAGEAEVEGKSREEKEREKKRERDDEEMGVSSSSGDARDAKEGGKGEGPKRKMRDDADLLHPLQMQLTAAAAAAPSSSSSSPSSSSSSSSSTSSSSPTRFPASSLPSSASLSSLSSFPTSSLSLLHPIDHPLLHQPSTSSSSSSSPVFPPSSTSSLLSADPSPWLSSASSSSWPNDSAASSLSSATAAIGSPTPLPPFSFTAQQEASPMLLSAMSPSPSPTLLPSPSSSNTRPASANQPHRP